MAQRTDELEALYRERYSTFRDVLTGVTGSYETAREVVQEAFARALREQKSFRGDGSLEAWVWKIAFRLALRNKRDPRLADDATAVGSLDSHVDADVRAAVRKLPPKRRLVVFLRFFADLSYAEIAQACEISEGTVAATLAQARDELLELLDEQEVLR